MKTIIIILFSCLFKISANAQSDIETLTHKLINKRWELEKVIAMGKAMEAPDKIKKELCGIFKPDFSFQSCDISKRDAHWKIVDRRDHLCIETWRENKKLYLKILKLDDNILVTEVTKLGFKSVQIFKAKT